MTKKKPLGEVKCLAIVARPKGNHQACTETAHASIYKVKEHIRSFSLIHFFCVLILNKSKKGNKAKGT